jgi:hypothetical protein
MSKNNTNQQAIPEEEHNLANGVLIRRCPHCKELVHPNTYLRTNEMFPFGTEFNESAVQRTYCANCNAMLETWFRRRTKDQPAEFSTRAWRWNSEETQVTTSDPIFEKLVPSEEACKYRNEEAHDSKAAHKIMRWERQLSGPRFQCDDPLITVVLLKKDMSDSTREDMIEKIKQQIKKSKGGGLRKCEETSSTIELHFNLKGPEQWVIFELRRKGILPWSTTVWRHNANRRYEVREWDYKNDCEASPPTAEELTAKIVKKKTRSSKTDDPLTDAVKKLIDKFREIGEDNPEIEDTIIRDYTFDAIVNGFILPIPNYVAPRSFYLDDRSANLKVHRAIQRFIKNALPIADSKNLSAQQRLDLINAPELQADDFFGYLDDISRYVQSGE